MRELTWKCHVCKQERPDVAISVFTHDRSAEFDLPPGTMKENIRYCNDNPSCVEAAPTTFLIPKKKEEKPPYPPGTRYGLASRRQL